MLASAFKGDVAPLEVEPVLNHSVHRIPSRPWPTGLALMGLSFLGALMWLAWQVIRIPLLTFLVMFEPLVNFALSTLALLVALTAILWEFTDPRHFPIWTVLAASLVCVLGLALYHALIHALSLGSNRLRRNDQF